MDERVGAPYETSLAAPEGTLVTDTPRKLVARVPFGDRVFDLTSMLAASVTLAIVGATLFFLTWRSLPALGETGVFRFFTSSVWNQDLGKFGVLGLLTGTLLIAGVALVIAVPTSTGLALFVNEYAPARLRRTLVASIDLLAALPSLLFGMWGLKALQGPLQGVAKFFADHLSAIPLFRIDKGDALTGSSFMAGLVVGIMILPIITSVMRDVMAQCPRDLCEAAYGLGASRWGMIQAVILPFSRPGRIGAVLLGLGRALGETIAVALIITPSITANTRVLTQGGGSIAQHIATSFGEASPVGTSGLIAAGFALFLMTLVVNMIARAIVARSGDFEGTRLPKSRQQQAPPGGSAEEAPDSVPVLGAGGPGLPVRTRW